MNCEQIIEIKKAFMNGEISGEQARSVRLHLAGCTACASHLSPSEWVELLPAIDEEIEPTGDFSKRFHARLAARQNENTLPVRTKTFRWISITTWGWSQRLAAVGAFAALILVGIFFGRHLSESPDRPLLYGELSIVENMDLLQEMAVINNLELLENFDAIESLASDAEILDRQRSTP